MKANIFNKKIISFFLNLSKKSEIDVYTGTYGRLYYTSESGSRAYAELHGSQFPAPKYFWKVVHNKATNQAIAFVGVNDAHLSELTELQEIFQACRFWWTNLKP